MAWMVAASSAAALLLAPRPATACSPPPDPASNEPPCAFVQLWTPAPTFPLQLEGAIRIGTFDRLGGALAPQPTFDPNAARKFKRAFATVVSVRTEGTSWVGPLGSMTRV